MPTQEGYPAQLAIFATGSNPKSNREMGELWHIQTLEYYKAVKMSEPALKVGLDHLNKSGQLENNMKDKTIDLKCESH